MKLLFITKNMENYVEKSSFYLAEVLKQKVDLTVWHDHGDIKEILSVLPEQPDFILLNDFKPDYCPFIRNLRTSSIPYGAMVHDLKYKTKQRKKWLAQEKVEHIFSVYKRPFQALFPEFVDKMHWLPHHVPADVFYDRGKNRPVNWLLAGAVIQHIYPMRTAFQNILRNEKGFINLKHPGYRNIDPSELSYMTGTQYAGELNRAKMLVTCDSIEHFALLKYFEASACGTLILGTENDELNELGFKDGITIVKVDPSTIREKAYYYLNNHTSREEIIQRAKQLIEEKHTTEIRTDELLKQISLILEKKRGRLT